MLMRRRLFNLFHAKEMKKRMNIETKMLKRKFAAQDRREKKKLKILLDKKDRTYSKEMKQMNVEIHVYHHTFHAMLLLLLLLLSHSFSLYFSLTHHYCYYYCCCLSLPTVTTATALPTTAAALHIPTATLLLPLILLMILLPLTPYCYY